MADPLSVAASVIAIASLAVNGTKTLLKDLTIIADAPKTIQNLKTDLAAINDALSSLQDITDAEWTILGDQVAYKTKEAIDTYRDAYTTFHRKLLHWTRHSMQIEGKQQKLVPRDRISLGLFKEGQINAMTDHIQACKNSLILVVSLDGCHPSLSFKRCCGAPPSLPVMPYIHGSESTSIDWRRRLTLHCADSRPRL